MVFYMFSKYIINVHNIYSEPCESFMNVLHWMRTFIFRINYKGYLIIIHFLVREDTGSATHYKLDIWKQLLMLLKTKHILIRNICEMPFKIYFRSFMIIWYWKKNCFTSNKNKFKRKQNPKTLHNSFSWLH